MANIEPQSFETQTDNNGNWSYDVLNTLSPGMHTMVIQDEYGQSKELGMFVVKDDRSGIVDRVTTFISMDYVYAAIAWLVIILFLALNILRLARHIDQEAKKKKTKYYRHAIVFCAVAMVITLAVGVSVNYKTRMFDSFWKKINPSAQKLMKVSGAVVDPITLQGVSGVDLASLNTSIHTAQGGFYAFEDIDAYYGIRITHPQLQRALVILISDVKPDQRFDIYFDPKMYNTLNSYLVAVMQQKWSKAYDLLAAVSKEKITMNDLSKVASIFNAKNLSDQELVVSKVEVINDFFNERYSVRFDNVVKISVTNGQAKEEYLLVKEGNEWRIVQ